ncbi:MAG: NADH-quinone oxidoreductase subunit C [Opitutaceae bacterium]|nr:NADH-quinone oxidoreductase subunit C [Opitutaceae bacterium]
MIESQPTEIVTLDRLKDAVRIKWAAHARLVQIGCTKTAEDQYEINYSFDENLKFSNLRIVVNPATDRVPSISDIYWNAFFYENEVHDLFGITIEGMAIDFKGNFYRMAVKHPFAAPAGQKKS